MSTYKNSGKTSHDIIWKYYCHVETILQGHLQVSIVCNEDIAVFIYAISFNTQLSQIIENFQNVYFSAHV